MPKITDAAIQELSLVFEQDGIDYAPRNKNARVLMVKSGEKKPSFFERLMQKAGFDWPVTEDVADGVDDDGDGSSDYNDIVSLLSQTYGDLQSAMYMQSAAARSNAVKVVLDEFKERIEAMYAGKDLDKKAGARHSAADKAKLDSMGDNIDAMQKQHAKMGDKLQGMAELHKSLTTAADKPKDGEGDDDDPADEAAAKAAAVAAKAAEVTPPAAAVDAGATLAIGTLAPMPDAAAIAALVGETLKAQFAEIDAKFAAQQTALDARFAAIEKAATEKAASVEQSALEKSLALIKAARTPSVPAVTQQYQGDGADGQPIMRTAPHIEKADAAPYRFDPMQSANGESGAIQTLLRATRLAQS